MSRSATPTDPEDQEVALGVGQPSTGERHGSAAGQHGATARGQNPTGRAILHEFATPSAARADEPLRSMSERVVTGEVRGWRAVSFVGE
jgi:hypothetical protein